MKTKTTSATTPYADLIVGFQEVLAKHTQASEKFGVAKYRKARDCGVEIEKTREDARMSGVVVLQKFNAILTDLQHLREGTSEVRVSVRSRPKRCIHCDKLEQASKAHRDRDGEWVCDGCWDERMA